MKIKGLKPKGKRHERTTPHETEFIKGQIWKTPAEYIVITEVGKWLIHYRLGSRPEMHGTAARMNTKQEVQAYLERNDGKLLKGTA